MKITYLNLLEMIRDGKQPQKIKIENYVYEWKNNRGAPQGSYWYDEETLNMFEGFTIINQATEECIEIMKLKVERQLKRMDGVIDEKNS